MIKMMNRRLWRLNIRLTEVEIQMIREMQEQSTCRTVSDYARLVLLAKPVRIIHRNQSIDDLLTAITKLQTACQEHFDAIVGFMAKYTADPSYPTAKMYVSMIHFQQNAAKQILEKILSITSQIIKNDSEHNNQPQFPEEPPVQ